MTELASPSFDGYPVVSQDALTIFFASDRDTPYVGRRSIWRASRATSEASFGTPSRVPELSTAADAVPGWISADGCRLYLTITDDGGSSLYVAERGR